MKKFTLLTILVCFVLTLFGGCKADTNLMDYVSELRSDVFYGQSENYNVKGCYGFKETPFINDGKVGEIKNSLVFRLLDKELDGALYSLTLIYGGQTYSSDFKFNPITHSLVAVVDVDDFSLKEFTVSIVCSSQIEQVTLKSMLPDGTISPHVALQHLKKGQSALLQSLTDVDGRLLAELYLRVLVKEEKPYWYVGIARGSENLKALLIDGLNGEILAVREIF